MEYALGLTGDSATPEGDLLDDPELHQEPKLDARRRQRRQLEQARVLDGRGEEPVADGEEILLERACERRRGRLDVLACQLAFCGKRDDGVAGEGKGGELGAGGGIVGRRS